MMDTPSATLVHMTDLQKDLNSRLWSMKLISVSTERCVLSWLKVNRKDSLLK